MEATAPKPPSIPPTPDTAFLHIPVTVWMLIRVQAVAGALALALAGVLWAEIRRVESTLQEDIRGIRVDLRDIRGRMDALQVDVGRTREELAVMRAAIDQHTALLLDVKSDIKALRAAQEQQALALARIEALLSRRGHSPRVEP
jgi:septal ring factor EnvC (AmiA/AmiB activator)